MISIYKYDRQRLVTFFTHLIVICMLFFLPEFMLNYSSAHRHPMMERLMYQKATIFVIVFYLNYYLIINRTLFGKRQNYLMFFVWNLVIIIAFVVCFYYLRTWIWDHPQPKGHYHEVPRTVLIIRGWSYILRDVAMLVLTIALSTALKFAENWSRLEKRHEQLLASQKTEELQNLKSQLNPHFLFNTLNTIYSLIDIDTKEAQRAIHQLSKLLRHVLYDTGQTQTLAQEIDFANTYISLMEMRLGEGTVHADFSHIADEKIQLAPMLFVTLIENAFKHGNTGVKDQPIEISISSDSNGTVTCRTYNHYVPGTSANRDKGGIGLTNLRRRLQLIYGERANLSTRIDGNTYTAVLTIKTQTDR